VSLGVMWLLAQVGGDFDRLVLSLDSNG
jgi:hypothetical protein